MRNVEAGVVDARRHGLGKGRIVLSIDGERFLPREVPEHWRRHDASRAVALDDRHQAVVGEILRHRLTRPLLAGSRMNRRDDYDKRGRGPILVHRFIQLMQLDVPSAGQPP